jgi:hypothetical protein
MTCFILAETNVSVKKILFVIFTLFSIINCSAQENIQKKNRLTNNVIERFHVLKDNEQTKDGFYQAIYKRKTAVASGNYTKGKRTGVWYFYSPNGTVLQTYNYNKDSLQYEAREDSTSNLRYLIDKEIADTDKVTKPIKAGGRYYGYLPYLGLYKIPFNPYIYGTPNCTAVIELLISPLGRLAEYRVRTVCAIFDYDQTITMNVNLFKEEDKRFIPATYNHQPILSRIIIKCRVTDDGGLDFYR